MNDRKVNPYITIIQHNDRTFYGIIKIKSKEFTSLYDLNAMPTYERQLMMEYADTWWWRSNRTIPISVYMSMEMEQFEKYCIRFNTNTIQSITGPNISLSELPSKRIKRRNLTLKKIKK